MNRESKAFGQVRPINNRRFYFVLWSLDVRGTKYHVERWHCVLPILGLPVEGNGISLRIYRSIIDPVWLRLVTVQTSRPVGDEDEVAVGIVIDPTPLAPRLMEGGIAEKSQSHCPVPAVHAG